jgi:NAD(P)-dependent dehydrogenase (short-subunit alcohol dehydrogenase family)
VAKARRVWFITGVSSGFGRALALEVLAAGDCVAGTVRQAAQLAAFRSLAPGRAHAYALDVTQPHAIASVIEQALRDCGGRIDVLVNNAGYGLIGAVEEASDTEVRDLFETNFFGLLNLTRAVVPVMRAQRAGHIFNLSSLSGVVGMAGIGMYCASKFAVEGLSESLAAELAAFGIRVTIVEPGSFRTDFAGRSMRIAGQALAEYAATPAGQLRGMIAGYQGHEPGDPVKAMRAVIETANAAQPPLRLVLGPDALHAARAKLRSLAENYDACETLGRSTDLA